MPINTEVTCWRLTGNNSNKRNKAEKTSFRVHRQQLLSLEFKDQFEKKAKILTTLVLPPPNAFTEEQLHDLEFGDMSLYDIIISLVVSLWKYYLKQGQTIDYEILKTSAESPLTQILINGFFFDKSFTTILQKIEGIKNSVDETERPDLFIDYINSDQFTPGVPAFSTKYVNTVTFMLYGQYLTLAAIIADGYLGANHDWFVKLIPKPGKKWFEQKTPLNFVPGKIERPTEAIETLKKDPTYEHLTLDKALLHLQGQISLEQALAPDSVKGGTRTRKLRKHKLHKNKRTLRSRTHKRLSATAKSRIMRGK